jgi:hypothetical protein
MKIALIVAGVLFGLLLIGLLGWLTWVGLEMQVGMSPDTAVVAGSEMKAPTRKAIEKLVPLRPGETIEFFYSAGLWSFEEDGNLVTNQRVVSYMTEDGEFTLNEADLDDIVRVVPEFSDSWLEDSLVWVELAEGDGFYLLLSCEWGGDRKAIDYLAKRGIKVSSASDPGPAEAPDFEQSAESPEEMPEETPEENSEEPTAELAVD